MNRPFSISSGANRNAVQRRPITPYEKQLWAEMAQLLMLAGLAESSKWEAKDIVFHGEIGRAHV